MTGRTLGRDVAVGALFVAAACGFGLWAEEANPYRLAQARTVLLYAVLALSWDLLARTGQLSLAHAAFHGLGAYTSVLVVRGTATDPLVGVLAGALVSAAVASGLGWVTLRLHGIYFAIATLAFSEVLRIAANQTPWAGGATGLVTVPLFGGRTVLQYLFALAVLTALMALSRGLQGSRWAYAFAAVRTNEAVARALGVPVVGCKVAAFAVSAFFAGLTGATYAHAFLFINPLESFHLAISVAALVAPIFGGLYSTAGPVVGAVLLRGGEDLLREQLGAGYPLLYGVILAGAILFLPRGLLGLLPRGPVPRPAGRGTPRAVAGGTEEA